MRSADAVRRRGWIVAALASHAWAEKPDYLHGYLDALLDSRFPDHGLRVQAIEADGRVRVTSRTCLAPTQRRDIERLFAKTRRVRAVVWDATALCDAPAPSPEGAVQIELRPLPEAELCAPYIADPRQPRAAGELDFVVAVGVRTAQELDWRYSSAWQAGFEFKSPTARRARLMLEHFHGHSPNGQFYRERLRYSGLGLYLGF